MKFGNFSINRCAISGIFRNIPDRGSPRANDPSTRPDRKPFLRPPNDGDPVPNRLGSTSTTSSTRWIPPMINGKADRTSPRSCETRPSFPRRFRPPPAMRRLRFSSSPSQQPPSALGSSNRPPYATDRTRKDFWIRSFGGNFRPLTL